MKRIALLFFMTIVLTSLQSYAGNDWRVNRILHEGDMVYVATDQGLFVLDKTAGLQGRKESPSSFLTDICLHEGIIYGIGWETLDIWNHGQHSEVLLDVYDYRAYYSDSKDEYWRWPQMAFAPDGTLWISLGNELGKYRNGIYFVSENLFGTITDAERIKGITTDQEGTLWIASSSGSERFGCAKYSKSEGLVPLAMDYSQDVHAVKIDTKGTKWFATFKGLVCYDNAGEHLCIELPEEYANGINDLCVLPEGGVLCATGNHLLYYDAGQYKKVCQVASSNYITCIDADGDSFYIGTPDGIFRYENGELAQVLLPGQTTGIQNYTSTVQRSNSSTVYDLQGRKMKNEKVKSKNDRALPKGIYIVNGKKFVVK